LKAFKNPALSILHIRALEQGSNSDLLTSLHDDTSGVLLAAKTFVLEFVGEEAMESQQNYGHDGPRTITRVLDTSVALSAQVPKDSRFDVVIFSRWPSLTLEESETMLTDARAFMELGGWLVTLDPHTLAEDR
jgi:hypothetical protein